VERVGDRVRLLSKNGHDWTGRFPWIVEAARKIKRSQFILDGEALVLSVDGISDFNALHSRQHDNEVQLYAFDLLALDGDDLRRLPLSMRKTNLDEILRRRPQGIFVATFDRGEIGPQLFEAACRMGLEGLVSKRTDRAYRPAVATTGSRSRTGRILPIAALPIGRLCPEVRQSNVRYSLTK
jgi:ATP-dependent DNA ligase